MHYPRTHLGHYEKEWIIIGTCFCFFGDVKRTIKQFNFRKVIIVRFKQSANLRSTTKELCGSIGKAKHQITNVSLITAAKALYINILYVINLLAYNIESNFL